MFLEKEKEGVKPEEELVVGSVSLGNLEALGRIVIDLTLDDD